MRLSKYLKEDVMPENYMTAYFEERTNRHIRIVQNNLDVLSKSNKDISSELKERSALHDQSKFSNEEYVPYIFMTWKRKLEKEGKSFEYPKDIEERVGEAIKHHISVNKHHPEAHNNPNDMNVVDVAEMVADWHAMSIEFGGNTKDWADKSIVKYGFDDNHKELIYNFIEDLI